MITGTVINWNDLRGYGFIRPDDGAADIFAHAKFCASGLRPAPGLRVSFQVVADERAPERGRADSIQLLGEKS
jgi:cold shock CspA family protein